MRDIFISYVEENSDLATTIAAGLEAEGFSTWYYERDSIPGPSYLLQTSRQIEAAKAMIVIISPHSLSSHQVTKEVIRAHESGKPFIPVLHDISHVEFGTRQPEWREAIGSATSITIPSQGVTTIVPRILQGVKGLGISPSGTDGLEAPQFVPSPTPTVARHGQDAERDRMGPSLWPKVAIGVVALALLAGGATTLLSRDGPKTEHQTIVTNFATPEETFDPVDAQAGEGVVELPEEDFASAADKALKTSAGRFKVMHALLTKEACPPTYIPEPCYVASGSDRYLLMTLAPAGGGTAGLSQVFTTEAHQSSLGFGTGLQAGAYSVSLDTTNNTVRIIYGILSAKAAEERVYLYWPKNPTLILPVTE